MYDFTITKEKYNKVLEVLSSCQNEDQVEVWTDWTNRLNIPKDKRVSLNYYGQLAFKQFYKEMNHGEDE